MTDFRERALKQVIDSLDADFFEVVTGLSVEDVRTLNDIGLFNAQHMNHAIHAIYQFKRFESASSLDYALTPEERELRYANEQFGLLGDRQQGRGSVGIREGVVSVQIAAAVTAQVVADFTAHAK